MIKCIIQFLSGQPHTDMQAEKHTDTHLESQKSQCPGGRNSYEHLSQWAKIESDVCPAVSAIFILPMTTHLGRSLWLCVHLSVFVWVWTYVQTATCTEANLHLIPACGLVWLSTYILSFQGDSGNTSRHPLLMYFDIDWQVFTPFEPCKQTVLYLVIESSWPVNQVVW